MEPPTDLDKCLAIVILRTLRLSQEGLADRLHYRKSTVVDVERWFRELAFAQAESMCNDQDLRQKANQILAKLENIDVPTAMKIGGVSPAEILRHYRGTEYLDSKAKRVPTDPTIAKAQQHFDRLADAAKQLVSSLQKIMAPRYDHDPADGVRDKGLDLGAALGESIAEIAFWMRLEDIADALQTDPLAEHKYKVRDVDTAYLEKCLALHYEHQFGKLRHRWNTDNEMRKDCGQLLDNLVSLSQSGNVKFCPNCPSCQAIGSTQPRVNH